MEIVSRGVRDPFCMHSIFNEGIMSAHVETFEQYCIRKYCAFIGTTSWWHWRRHCLLQEQKARIWSLLKPKLGVWYHLFTNDKFPMANNLKRHGQKVWQSTKINCKFSDGVCNTVDVMISLCQDCNKAVSIWFTPKPLKTYIILWTDPERGT